MIGVLHGASARAQENLEGGHPLRKGIIPISGRKMKLLRFAERGRFYQGH